MKINHMLIAKDICKTYDHAPIIQNLSLSIQPGEMVAIVGPSGTGKTTLLYLLSTLDQPDSGSIVYEVIEVTQLKGRRWLNLGK